MAYGILWTVNDQPTIARILPKGIHPVMAANETRVFDRGLRVHPKELMGECTRSLNYIFGH